MTKSMLLSLVNFSLVLPIIIKKLKIEKLENVINKKLVMLL